MQKSYLEWLPLDIYYKLAASMDLIIAPGMVGDLDYLMPRELQQFWLDCKSAHKYTLAGAASLPCIASPLSDYKEAIKHGETGFLAETVDQWMEYIDLLIHDVDFRKKIGLAARKDIVENWNLYNRMEEFVTILKGKDEVKTSYEVLGEVKADHIDITHMQESPKVMVFVPVHNGIKYLDQCLESLLSQPYPKQEIIVSDNGSTDGSRELIKEKYPMAKLYEWDYFEMTNPGYNEAVKNSDCEYFVELGHDDKLVENFWETVLPYFSNPRIGFVRVGCYQFSDRSPEGSWWKPVPWMNPLDILVQNKVMISSPRRRKAVLAIGDGDYNCFFGDWDNWIRLVLDGWKWATCPKPMFWYRRHPGAQSFNYDSRLDGPAYTYMRKKWLPTAVRYGLQVTSFATPDHFAEYKKALSASNLEFKEIK
jgi:glycosyltransferase involved in cell wall biosynthesis